MDFSEFWVLADGPDDADSQVGHFVERYIIRHLKDDGVVISGRISKQLLRRVDVIVQSRIDPRIQTRSDVVQDAIARWVQEWDKINPDGAGGVLSVESQVLMAQQQWQWREAFVVAIEGAIDKMRSNGDYTTVPLLKQAVEVRREQYIIEKVDKSVIAKLDRLLYRINDLL